MNRFLSSWHGVAWLAAAMMTAALAGCPTAERTKSSPSPKNPEPAVSETPSPEAAQAAKPGATAKTELPVKAAEEGSPKPTESPAKPDNEPAKEEPVEKPRELGPPLVENVDKLKRLAPDMPVWLDLENKQVVFLGAVCRADYPLEFFVTYPDRAYEAVVESSARPSVVHAGLLELGAKSGHPAQFQPDFVPPTGTEVAIELRWKDADGKVRSSPAQDWVRNVATKKALDVNWVFAGSRFVTDEETHQEHYMGDGGDFICLLNLTTATLDLPLRSASALESRLFEAYVEHLPPAGTPVTLLLKPKP